MLFSRCPNCQTTFRITADTLRVARGAVRCGNCATVYSAFSGLRQDSLDPGMQADEDYLSPTLQTQELASIEDIESPALDDPAADPRTRHDDADAAPEQTPVPSRDDELAADVGEMQRSIPATPTASDEPAELTLEQAHDDEPTRDESERPVAAEHAASEAAAAPHTGATSGLLQFEVPADDEWSQLLKEIEDASSDAQVPDPASSAEARNYDDELASVDPERGEPAGDLFDIGEPDVLETGDEGVLGQDDRHSGPAPVTAHAGTAAKAVATKSMLDDDADVATAQTEQPITAEEIDATLSAEPDADIMAALESGLGPPRANDAPRRAWRVGATVMALLLVGQLVHHNRTLLATQPVVGTLIQRSYALLGAPLAPGWDLEQYEITNWAATAGETESGVGNLRITAQIRNGGPAAQPYPSLQLELKDRWEAVVGRRVFSPREYLGVDFDTSTLMSSGETVPAELTVVDPGLDASGFELDVCLASGNASYRCSADRVFD